MFPRWRFQRRVPHYRTTGAQGPGGNSAAPSDVPARDRSRLTKQAPGRQVNVSLARTVQYRGFVFGRVAREKLTAWNPQNRRSLAGIFPQDK